MELIVTQSVVNGVTINRGPVPSRECYRMIWTDEQQQNGGEVMALWQTTGRTSTINHLYCATERNECIVMATGLGMTVPEEPPY